MGVATADDDFTSSPPLPDMLTAMPTMSNTPMVPATSHLRLLLGWGAEGDGDEERTVFSAKLSWREAPTPVSSSIMRLALWDMVDVWRGLC